MYGDNYFEGVKTIRGVLNVFFLICNFKYGSTKFKFPFDICNSITMKCAFCGKVDSLNSCGVSA